MAFKYSMPKILLGELIILSISGLLRQFFKAIALAVGGFFPFLSSFLRVFLKSSGSVAKISAISFKRELSSVSVPKHTLSIIPV